MSQTQVEPYVIDTTASFSFANVTVTTNLLANNNAGTISTGTTGQVLTSTGTKTIWDNSINPFMLMGA